MDAALQNDSQMASAENWSGYLSIALFRHDISNKAVASASSLPTPWQAFINKKTYSVKI